MRVSEIRVKRIRVNQGLGVLPKKNLENWSKLTVTQCFIVKVSICGGFFFVSPIRTGALIYTYMRHYFFRWEDNVFDILTDLF